MAQTYKADAFPIGNAFAHHFRTLVSNLTQFGVSQVGSGGNRMFHWPKSHQDVLYRLWLLRRLTFVCSLLPVLSLASVGAPMETLLGGFSIRSIARCAAWRCFSSRLGGCFVLVTGNRISDFSCSALAVILRAPAERRDPDLFSVLPHTFCVQRD